MGHRKPKRSNKIAKRKLQSSVSLQTNKLFQQALVAHKQGNLQQAQEMYIKILSRTPNHIDSLHCLGIAKMQLRDFSPAEQLFKQAIKYKPDFHLAYNNLGYLYNQTGDTTNAISALIKAIQMWPKYAEAQGNLGIAYASEQRYVEAENVFRSALDNNPNLTDNYKNLSMVLSHQGKQTEAIEYLHKALDLDNNNVDILKSLGKLYREAGQTTVSIECYNHVIRFAPEDSEGYLGLALSLADNRDTQAALNKLHKALQLQPNSKWILYNLANLYEKSNQLEDAQKFANACYQLDLNFLPVLSLLATLKRRKGEYREALDYLKEISIEQEKEADIAANAYHELGNIYELHDEQTAAISNYNKMNNRLIQRYDPQGENRSRYQQLVKNCINFYKKKQNFKQEYSHPQSELSKNKNFTPTFMLGFQRSGTTLLDQILNTHPNIVVSDEYPFIIDLINYLPGGQESYPNNLNDLSDEDIESLKTIYLDRVEATIKPKNGCLYIDKFPLNTPHIDLINTIFPEAKIIFMKRHPLDVCLSSYIQNFKLDTITMNFLTLEDTANLYIKTLELYDEYKRIFNLNIHEIKYEDLVTSPREYLENLLSFLKVDWHENILNHQLHIKDRGRISTVSYKSVTEAINTKARYKWTKHREFLSPIIPILENKIKELSYEV